MSASGASRFASQPRATVRNGWKPRIGWLELQRLVILRAGFLKKHMVETCDGIKKKLK